MFAELCAHYVSMRFSQPLFGDSGAIWLPKGVPREVPNPPKIDKRAGLDPKVLPKASP